VVKMKFRNIIEGILVGTLALFSGCITPHDAKVYKDFYPREYVTNSSLSSNPTMDKTINNRDDITIDDLIEESDKYIEYIDFKKKYSQRIVTLKDLLEKKDYKKFDALARELGSELENDSNYYAQKYFERVKDFSYTQIGKTGVKRYWDGVYNGVRLKGHDAWDENSAYEVYPFQRTRKKLY